MSTTAVASNQVMPSSGSSYDREKSIIVRMNAEQRRLERPDAPRKGRFHRVRW